MPLGDLPYISPVTPLYLPYIRAKVVAYGRSAFNPRRGKTNPAACRKALGPYGGFWGPFVA